MSKYIIRLDDACEKRDIEKWNKMEELLDRYGIKPLVGIIPHCEDPAMEKYPVDTEFWDRVERWIDKGWSIALHGYNHVYSTRCGGINPVNQRSEFAGEPLAVQQEKIRKGIAIMREHGIEPEIFFAPSHTFDENTLKALQTESDIRIISDTVAFDTYQDGDFTYIPQLSGRVRKLPFRTVTFCYHPNTMKPNDFAYLQTFLQENKEKFADSIQLVMKERKQGILDRLLKKAYFARR